MLTKLIKRLTGAAVFCIGATLGTGSWAFMDYPTFEKHVCTAKMVNTAWQTIPIINEQRKARFYELLGSLQEDKRLCSRWYQEAYNAFGGTVNEDNRDLMLYISFDFFMKTLNDGYLRTSAEDRKYVFEHAIMLSEYMDDRLCAAFHFGLEVMHPSANSKAVAMCIDNMSDDTFSRFLGVIKRSIKAELDDYPSAKILTANEVLIAQKTLENAFSNFGEDLSEQEAAYFYDVITNPQGYTYAEQCQIGKIVNAIILDIDGRAGDLVRLMILSP